MWELAATLIEKFGPRQACWLCVLLTAGGGWFFSTHFATAAELNKESDAAAQAQSISTKELSLMRAEMAELKGDAIAKRIFDYRVLHCDTPKEQRQEKRWLIDQMRVDSDKYRKATGEHFVLPRCEDL